MKFKKAWHNFFFFLHSITFRWQSQPFVGLIRNRISSYFMYEFCPCRQATYKMCLIKFRPDREGDVVIPNRPIRVELPPSQHGRTASAHGQEPFENKESSRERARTQHQAVVIEQIASETSKFEIRHGSTFGPVPTTTKRGPLHERNDSQKDSAQVRRSGSLAHAKNPGQSTASYRSTRERVVVVDDSGRRREYYRRDDSGR